MHSFPFLVAFSVLFLALPRSGAVAGSKDLLGRPFEAALARLGPPDEGGADIDVQTWMWKDASGKRARLSVHAGIVVHVDATLATAEIPRRTVPAEGAYPSQPVVELLARLGNPERVSGFRPQPPPPSPGLRPTGHSEAALVYGEQVILVSADRVLRVWVPSADLRHGPR